MALGVLQGILLAGAIFASYSRDQSIGQTLLMAVAIALSISIGGVKALISQVVIHACAHPRSFSGFARLDHWLRALLCTANLQNHRDYLVLHRFHHRFTNTERDPNWLRPGTTWLSYVSTLFFRQIAFLTRPDYKQEFARIFPLSNRVRETAIKARSRIVRFCCEYSMTVSNIVLISGAVAAGFILLGPIGIFLAFCWWLAPVVVGQILIADFAYRSHHGLPARADCKPYSGQDTWALRDGFVYRSVNWLTWGFYDHRAHHIKPSHSVWASRELEDVR